LRFAAENAGHAAQHADQQNKKEAMVHPGPPLAIMPQNLFQFS
jgi:hypothetical protein